VPLATALAAGNAVYLKPSEHTPRTSQALFDLLRSIYPRSRVEIALGAVRHQPVGKRVLDGVGVIEGGKVVAHRAALNSRYISPRLAFKRHRILRAGGSI
jgi:acyl-CoA reductase-like NAD-dependent aldehyde dehydrogenase